MNQSKDPLPNPISTFTEIRESTVHGMGVFARTRIPKGTVWWRGGPADVLLVNRAQFETLTTSVQSPLTRNFVESLLVYAYYVASYDSLVLCLDNARFVNHSTAPNSGDTGDREALCSVALRDIEVGEEIFENYLSYDRCPWQGVDAGHHDDTTVPASSLALGG